MRNKESFQEDYKGLTETTKNNQDLYKNLNNTQLHPKLTMKKIVNELLKIARSIVDAKQEAMKKRFNHSVEPIPGSIVYCDLVFWAEHSGIYVGNDEIVHRDGDGKIIKSSAEVFVNRLDGKNPTESIFVSCHNHNVFGLDEICQRALDALNDPRFEGYNLTSNNCHKFTSYCITGEIDNGITDCTFFNICNILKKHYGVNEWYKWKTAHNQLPKS